MQKQKIYLVSFADTRLGISALRFKQQAEAMEIFDEIFIYTEASLPLSFREEFKDKLYVDESSNQIYRYNAGGKASLAKKYPSRGFGYWCWKPKVCQMLLEQINDNDLLLYLDIGFEFNVERKDELKLMFALVDKNEFMGLYHNERERKWQKGDTLAHFNLLDNEEFLNSRQVGAGMIFMKKTSKSLKIINEWLDIFKNHFNFVDDSPSLIACDKEFVRNSHDQAILGILIKKYHCENFDTPFYYDRYNKALLYRRNKIYLSNNLFETMEFNNLFTIFKGGHATVHLQSFMDKYKLLQKQANNAKQEFKASFIIQNHLSYKLGKAMIRHSKNIFSLLKLPFILASLALAHKEQRLNYEQNLTSNEILKIPKIETLPDYKEALKIKNHFSYKLGEALIKRVKRNSKNPFKFALTGGGGIMIFLFKDLPRLRKEFKKK